MSPSLTRQLADIEAEIERVKAKRDRAIAHVADMRELEGEEREEFIRRARAVSDRFGSGVH